MEIFIRIIKRLYFLLWGDLITIPLPGNTTVGISLLVLILIPSGIYFTIRTRFLPFRLFPEMVRITAEKKNASKKGSISGLQSLIVSTATRVGMGNLVGVVAAISAGGAGAVFWMWIIALFGSSTAFIESTLAQLYKEKDPLYGGFRGGPAYYIHHMFAGKSKRRNRSLLAVLFALSGLICWCGVSQVIGNSVSSAFENAFHIPPPLHHHRPGGFRRRHRTAQTRHRQGAGYHGAGDGCLLFSDHRLCHREKRKPASFCLPAHFPGSFRASPGCGRRPGRRHHERRKTGAFFQRGRLRFRSLCRCRRRRQPSCQKRTAAVTGRFHRHPGHLYLHRHDHAADPRRSHRRPGRNGSSANLHAVPFRRSRRCLHRRHSLAVQLFHFHRHPVLCPAQHRLSVRRQLAVPEYL